MRIHATPTLPPDGVIVIENAVVVTDGRLENLVEVDGDNEHVEVILHPSAVDGFKQRFFPNANWRTFQ